MNQKFDYEYCLFFNDKIVNFIKKVSVDAKNCGVSKLFLYFNNTSDSLAKFDIENGTCDVRLFFDKIDFFKNFNDFYDVVGKKNGLKQLFEIDQRYIFSENLGICVQFDVTDLLNLTKIFNKEGNEECFVLIRKNSDGSKILCISTDTSYSAISITEATDVIESQIPTRCSEGEMFCQTNDLVNIFDISYIICSNAYGRLVNKTTYFIVDNNVAYFVNTNGRVLLFKKLESEFRKEFCISIPKNISKILSDIPKDSCIRVNLSENLCIFTCEGIEIHFSLINYSTQVKGLLYHKFDTTIAMSSKTLSNAFDFFGRCKDLAASSSLNISKSKNDSHVYGYMEERGNKIGSKLNKLESEYMNHEFSINFSFDILSLINIVLKRLVKEKEFELDLLYNRNSVSRFGNLIIKNYGITLLFAMK